MVDASKFQKPRRSGGRREPYTPDQLRAELAKARVKAFQAGKSRDKWKERARRLVAEVARLNRILENIRKEING